MADFEKFEFERSRGIVWVCDIANSSRYLNNDKTVDALELFLPRLYWTSALIVGAAGGRFIKWTGDGFLAWFAIPLHRELGRRAATLFEAAWHLTFLVNTTQLGIDTQEKFGIRHGITYEQDALLTKITYPGGYEALDLAGRAVVLAFRLSGIPAAFPGIVTQRDLVNSSSKYTTVTNGFQKWQVSPEDKLKYFKGERRGTESLYISTGRTTTRAINPKTLTRKIKTAIKLVEEPAKERTASMELASEFLTQMNASPEEWCRQVVKQYLTFLHDELLGSLKRALPLLEEAAQPPKSQ